MTALYRSFSSHLKEKFPGVPIRKIPLDAGFTCPNKDGTLSSDGCIFCDPYGSGPTGTGSLSVKKQIENGIGRQPRARYIAYFQAHCNTYAPIEELRRHFETAIGYPEVIGLFVGTRPDMLGKAVLDLLGEFHHRTYLAVELGLQSIRSRSLKWLNRNHTYQQFVSAYNELQTIGVETIIHLILGLPGERLEEVADTAREMNRLRAAGIKLHLLHVLQGTRLAELYRRGEFTPISQREYVDLVVSFLEVLDPAIVIHRLTGEREKSLFLAPDWAQNKHRVIEAIRRELRARNSRQGSLFRPIP